MKLIHFLGRQTGFSLIELIVIISVVSILAVYALPRLDLDVFRETGFIQQASSSIRYAQKQAIASGCEVDVSITAGGCFLSWKNTSSAASCPADGTTITNPGSGTLDFCSKSKPGSTADLPANFSFDKIGRPSTAQSINLGGRTITVEAETGYTHEI